MYRSILIGLLVILSQGCATYTTLSEFESGDPLVYSGTRHNLNVLGNRPVNHDLPIPSVLDFLPSVGTDTLLLFITLPTAISLSMIDDH